MSFANMVLFCFWFLVYVCIKCFAKFKNMYKTFANMWCVVLFGSKIRIQLNNAFIEEY